MGRLKNVNHNALSFAQIRGKNDCQLQISPNAFTPNDDGYHDTRKIEGLEGDLSITVRVFSRTGEMVFRSLGYATPWDATYKGNKLPAGTYHYIINAKKVNKP